MQKFTINKNDANQTIFKFLKKVYKSTPLSVIYKWFRKKDIKINDQRISDKNLILNEGDQVIVFDSNKTEKRDNFKPVDFQKLVVIYEDENILIADKPFNLEIHSEFNDSLDQMVRSYLMKKKEYNPETAQSFVVSHVHRLDKLTAGLVIYAKNKVSLDILLKAIQDKNLVEKYYVLRTKPNFPEKLVGEGWVFYDEKIKKTQYKDKIIGSEKRYKQARTIFKLLSTNKDYSLVEAKLETGRKHQIRATLSFYNFPILNDFRYGGKKVNKERMIYLKAYRLIFRNLPEPLSYLNNLEIALDKNFKI